MADGRVRRLEPGEERDFVTSAGIPFLDPFPDDEEGRRRVDGWASRIEPDRAWVVDAGGRFVGNSCVYTMDVTVPAGPGGLCGRVPMAGVSAVGVHPTHRRRGFLTQMMAEMLTDARHRGEPVAGLMASESSIYGRFGFGHATDDAFLTIDSRHARFTRPAQDVEIELIGTDEALKLLPPLFERCRLNRAGEPSRTQLAWQRDLADPPEERRGASAAFVAVCEGGYVWYRALGGDESGVNGEPIRIEELRGITAEVEAALWRFVFDLDLTGEIRARRRPVDEPVRWRLADPRQLSVRSVVDGLWVRILDVAGALEGRSYRRPGRLVLEVLAPPMATGSDPAPGSWVLEGGPDGATCRRAGPGEGADLRMGLADLGTLYLGGFRPSVLAGAGRIVELTPGSLDVADGLFATPLAPLAGTHF